MRRLLTTLGFAALAASAATPAQAWWNADWTQRTKVTLNTSAAGVETREAVSGALVAVRLHSGNFDFVNAKEDGSDLRFFAGDDKTPLAHSVERYDGINELALVWVQVPTVVPGSDKNAIYVYAGNPKAAPEAPAAVFGAPMLAAFHFSDREGQAADASGALKSALPVAQEVNGLLAGSARLAGEAIQFAANDRLRVAAGGAVTLSLWVKPDAVQRGALAQFGPLRVDLAAGKVVVQLGSAKPVIGADIVAGAWTHVAAALGGGKLMLYVGGVQAAQVDAVTPELFSELRVGGAGTTGLVDEVQVAATVRSADWLRLAVAAQGPDGKLLAATQEAPDAGAEEGQHGYMGVLVKNLTVDAWVVIVILGVMFAVACWVMLFKAVFVGRADKDNRRFLQRFRGATHDLLNLESGAAHPHSSLYRLYQAGVRELKKRHVGADEQNDAKRLSGASLNAVKASIDADMVRESHRLNSQMVLLTIAISGGPFLGLLGTVVGVMITFAAIAAAGDVNVNAIAPGIAAALLATVAGLGVAIPALFGYNYLASRIKNISADMQIFVDEFVTRVDETYGAR